ncbi:MAG TPA: hypothetical protein VJ694_00355 [Patescibacteria group bacterium]|nr:hypothetical protein [Patescibacteria group bacterium]
MKDMLSEKDIRRIGEEVGRVIEDNMNPQFEAIRNRLDVIETRMETDMVTRDYLDQKLAPINGKINVLVDVLHRNGTISDDQRRIVHS